MTLNNNNINNNNNMNLLEVKKHLADRQQFSFSLPNGTLVPIHFHVTEIGKISKHFIDCGGTLRNEETVSFQLWNADDYNHRLHPEKLLNIIELAQKSLQLRDESEIEVEYQGHTIEKYALAPTESGFALVSKQTDCLAKDQCGVPSEKKKLVMAELSANTCAPGSGCC